jgi:hypothetical protein
MLVACRFPLIEAARTTVRSDEKSRKSRDEDPCPARAAPWCHLRPDPRAGPGHRGVGFDAFFRSDHYLGIDPDDTGYRPTDSWTTLAGLAG